MSESSARKLKLDFQIDNWTWFINFIALGSGFIARILICAWIFFIYTKLDRRVKTMPKIHSLKIYCRKWPKTSFAYCFFRTGEDMDLHLLYSVYICKLVHMQIKVTWFILTNNLEILKNWPKYANWLLIWKMNFDWLFRVGVPIPIRFSAPTLYWLLVKII